MKTVFDNPEELEAKIEAYFDGLGKDDNGWYRIPPTLIGLAYHLDCSNRTLSRYIAAAECKDDPKKTKKRSQQCAYLLMRAKMRIERYLAEQLLLRSKTHGVEFALQNGYGWGQKQTVDVKSDVKAEVKTESTPVTRLSDEELMEQIRILSARVAEIMKREGLQNDDG